MSSSSSSFASKQTGTRTSSPARCRTAGSTASLLVPDLCVDARRYCCFCAVCAAVAFSSKQRLHINYFSRHSHSISSLNGTAWRSRASSIIVPTLTYLIVGVVSSLTIVSDYLPPNDTTLPPSRLKVHVQRVVNGLMTISSPPSAKLSWLDCVSPFHLKRP